MLSNEAINVHNTFLCMQSHVLMRSFSAQMMSMDFAIRLPTCVTQKLIVAMGGMNRTVVQVHNNIIIHCARMCTYVVYTYVSA